MKRKPIHRPRVLPRDFQSLKARILERETSRVAVAADGVEAMEAVVRTAAGVFEAAAQLDAQRFLEQ